MPSRAEVLAAAHRAQLSFRDDEIDRITADLEAIVARVQLLHVLSGAVEDDATTGTESQASTPSHGGSSPDSIPAASPAPVAGPDPLSVPPSRVAPEWHDGFFTVPRLRTHDAE